MILKRFYNDKLAQASYLIGCPATGEAAVIDANRHIEDYLQAAAEEGLRITAVTETHIHADYLSGSRELSQRTGATLYLSDEGDADWKYEFADEPNVRLVRHGDTIQVGAMKLDVVHTPGHTPEHISFVLTDEKSSPLPLGAFTGDFIFVGDVGRPDLLERAANFVGTMEKGAKTLFHSLTEFKKLPGHLLLWPAHGSGSACGKALGGVPVSTLAYEASANWALRMESETEFVGQVLAGQPEPPVYFKEMKRLNKVGPAILGGVKTPPRMAGDAIHAVLASDAITVDLRPFGQVAAGYIPGTINIPLDRAFVNWAGWLVPFDRPIFFVSESETAADEAARDLALIGLDNVQGWFGTDAIRAYEKQHGTLPITPQVGVEMALDATKSAGAAILDVRSEAEWLAGHIPGAIHVPLGYLPIRGLDIPSERPLFVHCGGGTRSAIACSILQKLGHREVTNIPGGFYEYRERGRPVETVSPMSSVA